MSGYVLFPTGHSPESIFVWGAPGSGKTNAYWCVAEKVAGKFWVLDTDMSVPDFLDGERFKRVVDRLTYEIPVEFEQGLEFVEKAVVDGEPGDWVVVDRIDWAWDAAQEEFSERVFGGSVDEHFLTYRQAIQQEKDKGKKAGNPFEGFTDWPTIKKRHARLMKGLMRAKAKGMHFYITAGEKKVDEKLDGGDLARDFGRIGYRPQGEKNNHHIPRTVLRFMGNNPQTWRMSTAPKDREREQLTEVPVRDFALDYLVKVGKWKMEVVG